MIEIEKVYEIPCSIKKVSPIREDIEKLVTSLNISEFDAYNIQLVLDEALTNAIDHGASNIKKQKIIVKFSIKNDLMTLYIKDPGGKPFDPDYFENIALSKAWGVGGRGIFLINHLMDEVTYLSIKNKATILMVKKQLTYKT